MFVARRALFIATLTAFAAGGVAPMLAQQEGPVQTTALINAASKSNVPLNPAMLTLQVDGHSTPITNVVPVRADTAQVAILVDDGLRGSFGTQLGDLAAFIRQLPPGIQVLLGYMRNGEVAKTGGFTTDHNAVAGTLRVPLASPGISGSPYFCLSDFVKHWPSAAPGARFVLMITNGVDPYNGSTSIMNQDSPYVQAAQEDAQRAGVAVYSIAYKDTGFRRGSYSGQNYLQQVGEATGGQSLYLGLGNPVSLAPFLGEFRTAIEQSYTISFPVNSARVKHDTLDRIKVKTSQPGVKIYAPDGVHPGAVE